MSPQVNRNKPAVNEPKAPVRGTDPAKSARPGTIQTHALLMADSHWNRLEALARRAFKGRTLPRSIENEEAAFIVALKGISLGLDPMYAMEHMAVINGKATIDGQAMLALIYSRSDIKVTFQPEAKSLEQCTVTMKRNGQEPYSVTWTLERAKRAGLLSKQGPWQTYPDQMLRWRAVSECGRVVAPDVIGGLYLHEEMGAVVDEHGEIVVIDPAKISSARDVTPTASNEEKKEEAAPLVDSVAPSTEKPVSVLSPSKEQLARLYALAAENRWPAADVKNYVLMTFQKQSSKDLSLLEYNRLCSFIIENPYPESEINADDLAAAAAVDKAMGTSTTEAPNELH